MSRPDILKIVISTEVEIDLRPWERLPPGYEDQILHFREEQKAQLEEFIRSIIEPIDEDVAKYEEAMKVL